MKFRYGALPNGQGPLPVVLLDLPALPGLRLPALVDSGAGGVRLDASLAEAMGVDVSAASPQSISIGGHGQLLRYDVPDVRLAVGKAEWTATVGFVDPWPFAHAVLGTAGFFDRFAVRLDAGRGVFAITR